MVEEIEACQCRMRFVSRGNEAGGDKALLHLAAGHAALKGPPFRGCARIPLISPKRTTLLRYLFSLPE